jgi:hypothetical protein
VGRDHERIPRRQTDALTRIPRDDLVSAMIAVEVAGDQVTDSEIVTMCELLRAAGTRLVPSESVPPLGHGRGARREEWCRSPVGAGEERWPVGDLTLPAAVACYHPATRTRNPDG